MLYSNMLYVMSPDPDNIRVLGQVIKFAGECHARLTLFDVIDSLPRTSRMLVTSVPIDNLRNGIVRNRLEQLEMLVSRMESGTVELRARVLFGHRAKQIMHEAKDSGYDLVIKSPERGRTDRFILKHCACPVWLLQPDDYDAAGQLQATHSPLIAAETCA